MYDKKPPQDEEDLLFLQPADVMYYGVPNDIVRRTTKCQCGGFLHFTHLTDFAKQRTLETVSCPECAIERQRQMHRLH